VAPDQFERGPSAEGTGTDDDYSHGRLEYQALDVGRLVRSIGTPHVDPTMIVLSDDPNQPGIAADFAVLHELAADVRLHVDLTGLPTIGTGHIEHLVIHRGRSYVAGASRLMLG
jgi:hypothetical protein